MPANWAVDEHKWNKSKGIAKKQYGLAEGTDQFYRVTAGIYKQMKGPIGHKGTIPAKVQKAIDEAMQPTARLDLSALQGLTNKQA